MIDVEQMRKSFNGTRALDGFTLHVGAGELFGLVGPNGAGKTTLMKVLSTLLPMDSGTAEIGGLNVNKQARETKRLIGYLPDQPGVYQDMSVRESWSSSRTLSNSRGRATAPPWTGLWSAVDWPIAAETPWSNSRLA
jgi:ABC-2 type transport system ATP-binding protein